MICSNCKSLNSDTSKFCIKCGTPLINNVNNASVSKNIQNLDQTNGYSEQFQTSYSQNVTRQSNINNMQPMQSNINRSKKANSFILTFKNFLVLIISFILKPFTTSKEKNNVFNEIKNSLFLTAIMSVISTIINLIMTMVSSVLVKTLDIKTFEYKTTIVWENLKEIKYFQIIFKELFVVASIILAIAIIYYLASLITKKNINFSKLLGISALSVVPLLICNLLLEPLTALIFPKISASISLIGLVYTIIILYENINSEILLDGNMKYYFNLICLSILAIAGYYLLINTATSSVQDGVNILNNFGILEG